MDKLECIPGDLVMTKTEPNDFIPNGIVCKFNEYVFRDKVYVSAVMLADNFICKKEDIAPIPLTPEILEKNGWKLDDSTWIYKKGYIRVFRLLDGKTYAAYIFEVRVFEFHFIHELQHLLYGLKINSEMEV